MKQQRQYPGASPYFDRHGKRRWRYRKRGFSAELGTEYGSPDFIERYEAAVNRKKGIGADRTIPGSMDDLISRFYRGNHFRKKLKPSTRKTYEMHLEKFRADFGRTLVKEWKLRHIKRVRDERIETPGAANALLKLLKQIFDLAVDDEMIVSNPARAVKLLKYERYEIHTWDEGELARYAEVYPPGTIQHTAMTLMLYTGASCVDAVKLGWQNVKDGRISYRRQKPLNNEPIEVDIRILPELQKVLDTLPPPTERMIFLWTKYGGPFKADSLSNQMSGWCNAAGLPECTAHGLRKALGRRLDERGATPSEIQAVLGHTTLKQVEVYTRGASRVLKADNAFSKLGNGTQDEQILTNHPKRFAKKTRK